MSKQLSIFQQGEDLPLFQQEHTHTKPLVGSTGQPIRCTPVEPHEVPGECDRCGHVPIRGVCLCPEQDPLPVCPLCGRPTSWEHYPDSPPLLICEPCGAFWDSPEEVYQP